MTEITLRLSGSQIYLIGFRPGGSTLSFAFENVAEGFLRIGETVLPLAGGRCKVPLCDCPQGDLAPVLVSENRAYLLPRFSRRGNGIFPAAPDGEDFAALRDRCRLLEETLREQTVLLTELREKVFGTALF